MNKEKKNLITILITIFILILLFGLTLFILYKKEYLSFNKDTSCNCSKDSPIEKNSDNDNKYFTEVSSNMSNDEVFDFWNRVKGNWAKVSFNDGMCVGSSLEINTNVTLSKFNSDGVVTYGIVSFNKINDKTVELKLIVPVNLNDQISGSTKATYTTLTIDMGEPNDNKISINRGGNWVEYEYVGDNKLIFNENTHYYYIDGGFSQDYYCDWYKKNH